MSRPLKAPAFRIPSISFIVFGGNSFMRGDGSPGPSLDAASSKKWHRLYFFPLPHQQGSLRLIILKEVSILSAFFLGVPSLLLVSGGVVDYKNNLSRKNTGKILRLRGLIVKCHRSGKSASRKLNNSPMGSAIINLRNCYNGQCSVFAISNYNKVAIC